MSRRLINAAFIALTGLGSSVSEGVPMLVGMLGAIWEVLITVGLSGCNPTISNDFLMFSTVNDLRNGSSIAWRKVHLFIAPKLSCAQSSRIWA